MNFSDRDDELVERVSKTQKKKEATALQKLGEKLVKLSNDLLKQLDLPEELHDAVLHAKTIKSNAARKRQMQFIGTVMRKIDASRIQESVDDIEQGNYQKALDFQETEQWRDELIRGNKNILEEILGSCAAADRQTLSQLIRNAVREKSSNNPPRASRRLFHYLKEIKRKSGENPL